MPPDLFGTPVRTRIVLFVAALGETYAWECTRSGVIACDYSDFGGSSMSSIGV
jgi:hypothetical protein